MRTSLCLKRLGEDCSFLEAFVVLIFIRSIFIVFVGR